MPPGKQGDPVPGSGSVGAAIDNSSLFQSIVESAPEILALLSGTGEILYVNAQASKVLGYRNDEIIGHNIFAFVYPDDAQRAAQEYSETVRTNGERVPSVLRLRDRSGGWVPFEIIANNRLQDPRLQSVVFTARDLRFREDLEVAIQRANADTEAEIADRTTELAKINAELRIENQARQQAEIRLQHTISLLNATLDSTADGILVVGNDGKISSCNHKFLELWHLSCDSSIGKNDKELLAQVADQLEKPSEFVEQVQSLYSDPSASSFDVLHFRDGRIFERYSQPQRIGEEITGRVWSFRDVTRARNLELELRQSQKMEAVGRLAGGVAHDFNNLLMLISGYVTQLLEKPSPDESHETCEQILATTRRAASLTRQLLAFSRKQPEVPGIADLNQIVLNLEPMLRRLLPDQVQLRVSVSPDAIPVYVDISQVEMMIMNLAINAKDAMAEGGRLSIVTHRPPVTGEAVTATRGSAVLEVSDTGHGMTPEVKSRIFEPFFTTKQLGRGTGLGLSTVLGIVERAGGRIEVRSEPFQGTTFEIQLPLVQSTAKATAVQTASAMPRLQGEETILLAEDEPGIRAMTRTYLENLGYRVLEAADGAEAIAQSLEYSGPIHLFVTDLLMPGIRGDSAVKEIRNYRQDIKVIYISGYADESVANHLGNILYKPFDFPELGQRIRAALDAQSSLPEREVDPAA